VDEGKLEKTLRELMNLSPRGIREHLRLNRPIYAVTSAYGHFGREPDEDLGTFTWEKTDLVPALKSAFGR
jgi:S-adenosylmethionine synthetase